MKERNQEMHILLTPKEMERLTQKMKESGIRNRSAYVRKMALDGYVVNLDTSDIKKVVSLLRYSSNNLNQVAKVANTTGSIYGDDIAALKVQLEKIWEAVRGIMTRLAAIK